MSVLKILSSLCYPFVHYMLFYNYKTSSILTIYIYSLFSRKKWWNIPNGRINDDLFTPWAMLWPLETTSKTADIGVETLGRSLCCITKWWSRLLSGVCSSMAPVPGGPGELPFRTVHVYTRRHQSTSPYMQVLCIQLKDSRQRKQRLLITRHVQDTILGTFICDFS